ncbi:uncharacterized protein PV09_01054 [Verruconis gallopava]|uniref:Uncharacterized protein n=1 Tax=Verruconis gallopava TaxID=253628 RepID=A0A0D2BA25_9PEZI|nr:uncharacterized protein PV09_01054 [Verruconis gallopava]KIW08119.1 hypothetical protein PV09_01054 [Verruconis gallopava]
MAPISDETSHLVNALATPEQLAVSNSQQDGVSAELETSMIFAGSRLTQAAGMLLRLPQDIIAQAIVLFQRFWVGPEGGSLHKHDVQDISAAALYLAAKLSALPKSPRSVVNTYAYLGSFKATFVAPRAYAEASDAEAYYVSEGAYQVRREKLVANELLVLRTLGFDVHVALPYSLCVNYLQALDVFADRDAASRLARRAFAQLNTALLSPQLLFLTHQPSSLATAAIYLAAREVGVKLPGDEWWEVFDTDREELGFLVVAMLSMEGFVRREADKWADRSVPSIA